ncbi:YihY family inner membrane protein [Pseudoduganella sp. GCM10020061]|uniref:YihY family inner membrane protein n=1 Tax=Pseudoduganella sp. GCM10020061 TaxID=3317345 RepID=UPI00362A71B7
MHHEPATPHPHRHGVLAHGMDVARGLTWSEVVDLVRFAHRRLSEERLPQVAGGLTFTTVLAVVPLLTIVFAVFTTFPVFTAFRAALEAYFVQSVMPKAIADTIVANLTAFAGKATRLSTIGAVVLLFTSTAMMGMIERAFNQIWRVQRPRPLSQRVMIYWALVTLGPLLIGLSLTMTTQLYVATSGLLESLPYLGAVLYTALSVLLTTGAFTLLYMWLPNRHVDWRDAVWGGLAAALAFEIAKRLFAVFIKQFPTYAIIYGALAALPLFLLWIYVSWLITLVGALITAALPVVKYERWWHKPVPGSEFVDAMAILKVMYASRELGDSTLVASSMIRKHTRIGYEEMTALLQQMESHGWVGRVRAPAPAHGPWRRKMRYDLDHWVLLVNPDKVRVADVYRIFAFAGGEGGRQEARSALELDTGALARQVEEAVERGLEQTLSAHFRRPAPP